MVLAESRSRRTNSPRRAAFEQAVAIRISQLFGAPYGTRSANLGGGDAAAGRLNAAEDVFRASLAAPNNGWALYGLSESIAAWGARTPSGSHAAAR